MPRTASSTILMAELSIVVWSTSTIELDFTGSGQYNPPGKPRHYRIRKKKAITGVLNGRDQNPTR